MTPKVDLLRALITIKQFEALEFIKKTLITLIYFSIFNSQHVLRITFHILQKKIHHILFFIYPKCKCKGENSFAFKSLTLEQISVISVSPYNYKILRKFANNYTF